MVRLQTILEVGSHYIICGLNNGEKRKLNLLPLLQKHAAIQGVSQLLELEMLKTAQIGTMGEVLWENIVTNSRNESWSYDISPDFFLKEGELV